jgi:hypothetical protein
MNQDQTQTSTKNRSRAITQQKIDKRIAAGDGDGVREDYKPWIKVRAFPSKGTSHIVPGVKVGRSHHLLSNAEYHYHIILEFDRSIIDIREQFPLFPQSETQAIASSLNVMPPSYPGTNVPLVMTTDFLITQLDSNGKERLVARSMKYAKEIEDASQRKKNRLLEKLEIERVFWERRNVEWKLVLYERISQIRIRNLLVLRSHANISPLLANTKNINNLLSVIEITDVSRIPLKAFLKKLSKLIYIEYVETKSLFFHLLWIQALEFDLSAELIDLAKPLSVKVAAFYPISMEMARHA